MHEGAEKQHKGAFEQLGHAKTPRRYLEKDRRLPSLSGFHHFAVPTPTSVDSLRVSLNSVKPSLESARVRLNSTGYAFQQHEGAVKQLKNAFQQHGGAKKKHEGGFEQHEGAEKQ